MRLLFEENVGQIVSVVLRKEVELHNFAKGESQVLSELKFSDRVGDVFDEESDFISLKGVCLVLRV